MKSVMNMVADVTLTEFAIQRVLRRDSQEARRGAWAHTWWDVCESLFHRIIALGYPADITDTWMYEDVF